MDYREILDVLAPCGLNCVKCLGYENGEVRAHARKLHALLRGLERHAERFSTFVAVFKKYPSFKEVLDFLVEVDCAGCRGNETKYPLCSIARCIKDRNIDFCFQCTEYPCSPEEIDQDLHGRWLEMNNRMRDIGVEAYYEETKDEDRYK